MTSPARTLDLTRGREHVRHLHRCGYKVAANVILQGMSRPINVRDKQDWILFRSQVSNHSREASFGDNLDAFMSDSDLASFSLSYRHVNWRTRSPRGATMDDEQWHRLHSALLKFAATYGCDRFTLWIDQVLHCSDALTEGTNWVTKGILLYLVMPVLYIGGPCDSSDEDNQRRLWVAVERMCALSNAGIFMNGGEGDATSKVGASLSLTQSLKWIASRIVGGTFNSCGLSWAEDYIAFRHLSVAIAKSKNAVGVLESFLTMDASEQHGRNAMISTMDAFNYSSDSQDMSFLRSEHLYHGTYLASKLEEKMTDTGKWHGLREWVQYKWDDGVLRDESVPERQQIIELTKWMLFADDDNGNDGYAVGLVSMRGEVGAMGIARLSGVSRKEKAKVLWFQRGLSPLGRQFARQMFYNIKLNDGLVNDIARHWQIEIGSPFAMLQGKHIRWTW